VSPFTDIIQLGTGSMLNPVLIELAARTGKPVMLKRGPAATYSQWLQMAGYALAQGNPDVMVCERGITTFETGTRNTLDLNAVHKIHSMSHLPIIVDTSHGTGDKDMVIPMAMAAVMAGADGIMVEVHNDPDNARCDGKQSLTLGDFSRLMDELHHMNLNHGRHIA